MNLLGLDLGSRLTGWCAGDGSTLPQVGAWPFPAIDKDYGLLLATLQDYLDVAFTRFRPGAVAYEAPILITNRHGGGYGDNLGKLRLLYPLGAFVEWYCLRAGVPCFEVTVQAIKKQLGGHQHAEKADLVHVARNCGLDLPLGPGAMDAADAFGCWLLLLRETDKARAIAWDQRIYGARPGALF